MREKSSNDWTVYLFIHFDYMDENIKNA